MLKIYRNIEINIKNSPELDPGYIPVEAYIRAYQKTAAKPIAIVIISNDDMISRFDTNIHGTQDMESADFSYIEVIVKFLIWARGGSTVAICGDDKIAEHIRSLYKRKGKRRFDYDFMTRVYEKKLRVISLPIDEVPPVKMSTRSIGRYLSGCRIGFDAGGSDRKVSAVINGKSIYSEEVAWFPKTEANPEYHYEEILKAFKTAASMMPRVDAIGVSSAGVYIDNKTMIASIFLKVPDDLFDKKVKDIYIRAAREIGNMPLVVANDGDVTALAGSMSLNVNSILGLAMGTSEAVGYIDSDGKITGWLNELAFAPVDLYEGAEIDDWSGDYGVGCKYFSQDAVIKLAPVSGIELDKNLSHADKLKAVQDLMEKNDSRAAAIYKSIGVYLGHTIPLYARFYNIEHVLLMGRVTSGKGGMILINTAKKIMEEEYPDVFTRVDLNLPDEKSRRVGQSIAAASLPQIEGESNE